MEIIKKFSQQSVNPSRDQIFNKLGKSFNQNNAISIIQNLCNEGYMYENDGQYYLN
jgi:hypothetical protein